MQTMTRRISYVAALLAVFYATVMLWVLRRFVVDDSYIPLRYVAHWLKGDGIVWNAGEQVEGYTSFLMIVLTAGLHLLGLDMLWAARLVQLLALTGLCWITLRSIRCWCTPPLRTLLQSVALVLLLTSLPILFWAMSGLETILFTALAIAAILCTLACLEGPHPHPFLTGTLFALATLARPEGMLFAAFGFVALLLQKRYFLRALLPFALVVGTHLLWRHSYYGDWLPNTYYAKLTGPLTGQRLMAGVHYVLPLFFSPPFLGLYAPALFLAALRDKTRLTGNLLLLSLLASYLAYVIYAGGDWMPMQRFLVPAIGLLVLMLVRGLLACEARIAAVPKIACLPLLVLLLGGMQVLRFYENPYPKYPLYLTAVAHYMAQHFPPGALVAINMAGIIPAETMELRYLDMLGLNDRTIARRALPSDAPMHGPGHEKGDGAYVLARQPDYIVWGDAISEGNTAEYPHYISEQEMQALPEFARHYRLKRAWIPLSHPDLATDGVPFLYYERVD